MTKILLGKLKSDADIYAMGETIYLSKHTFDCGWYWGFGYIGNSRCHYHFETFLKDAKLASELFESPNISDRDWWVIRDLFVQAYAIKKTAEVYKHGGNQTLLEGGVTDVLQDTAMVTRLNADLEKILNILWDYVISATNRV